MMPNFLFILMLTTPVWGQTTPNPRGRVTPMPPKVTQDPIELMHPATTIPHPLDAYRLTVSGEFNGVVVYPNSVPLKYFRFEWTPAGEIAVGSEFKAEYVKAVANRIYYGIVREEKEGSSSVDRIAWIDGRFLKLDRR